jgi:hypothetical protein
MALSSVSFHTPFGSLNRVVHALMIRLRSHLTFSTLIREYEISNPAVLPTAVPSGSGEANLRTLVAPDGKKGPICEPLTRRRRSWQEPIHAR